jgi:hypothetical protein
VDAAEDEVEDALGEDAVELHEGGVFAVGRGCRELDDVFVFRLDLSWRGFFFGYESRQHQVHVDSGLIVALILK